MHKKLYIQKLGNSRVLISFTQQNDSYLTNNSLALYKQEQSFKYYKHNILNIIHTGTEKDVATETRIDSHGQKQSLKYATWRPTISPAMPLTNKLGSVKRMQQVWILNYWTSMER